MSAEKCDPGMKSYPRRPLSITPLIGRPGRAADPPRHTRDKARSGELCNYNGRAELACWPRWPRPRRRQPRHVTDQLFPITTDSANCREGGSFHIPNNYGVSFVCQTFFSPVGGGVFNLETRMI